MNSELLTETANQELSDLDLDIHFITSDDAADQLMSCVVDSMGNGSNTSLGLRTCCW
ncbi:hypothetical protein ACFXOI_17185 [Streptomyces bacillaris]|uniref:hypothetical protein n=1 Tax=Streptomyces bacillaris TaxID=68179 RepID=UPI00345F48B1